MTPEGKVKAKVKKALLALGDDCWRFMPVQTGYGAPALDFLMAVRGRFVAIETKAPGKSLTPMQETTKAAIEAAGGIVLIVWDEDTLAIAMKIILALEFSPNVPPTPTYGHLGSVLNAIRSAASDPGLSWAAHRIIAEEDERQRGQHLRSKQPAQALGAAAGGHHGSPGEPPD